MDRLKLRRKDAQDALITLRAILVEPFSTIVRDATIQRFEYTFEAIWKYIKADLEETEGIQALSPKQCFRALFSAGKITESECVNLLEITDHRNETSHTYKSQVADLIFEKIPAITTAFEQLLEKL